VSEFTVEDRGHAFGVALGDRRSKLSDPFTHGQGVAESDPRIPKRSRLRTSP
jgi:hypothetical protein